MTGKLVSAGAEMTVGDGSTWWPPTTDSSARWQYLQPIWHGMRLPSPHASRTRDPPDDRMNRSYSQGPAGTPLPAAVLDPAIRLIIERAAALPRGLALLHRAPLESVAVQLATHTHCVARARDALEDGETRAAALECFAWAVRRGGRAPVSPQPDAPLPRSPEDLFRAAEERPASLAVLASASIEYAAIAFGVHPDLVFAARQLVARRGFPVTLAEDA